MNPEEIKAEIDRLNQEIADWKLSPDNWKKFESFLELTFSAKSSIGQEVIYNRYYCPICATKILAQKSLEAQPILDYLKNIQELKINEEGFFIALKEFLSTVYLCSMLNETGPSYLVAHLSDYIKLHFPNIKTEEDKNRVLSLRITSLALNTMISEVVTKLLDFIIPYVYSMNLDEETERKVIQFSIERVFGFVHKFSICYCEVSQTWIIMLFKFKHSIFEGLDIADPLIITKSIIRS